MKKKYFCHCNCHSEGTQLNGCQAKCFYCEGRPGDGNELFYSKQKKIEKLNPELIEPYKVMDVAVRRMSEKINEIIDKLNEK